MEAWKWHKNTKALTAKLTPEEFEDYFLTLFNYSPSWGIERDGELVGFVLIEPTNLPGFTKPTDGQVHIALARKAWGGEVIQTVAFHIIPAFFAVYPTALRLSAWTVESNYPARAVADAVGLRHGGQTPGRCTNGQWKRSAISLRTDKSGGTIIWAADPRPQPRAPTRATLPSRGRARNSRSSRGRVIKAQPGRLHLTRRLRQVQIPIYLIGLCHSSRLSLGSMGIYTHP